MILERKEGLDSSNLPIVGSKWMYKQFGPLVVESVDANRGKVHCNNVGQGENPWPGTLSMFQTSPDYTLLEVPSRKVEAIVEQTTKSLDRKLGIDKEGKPIINSVWNGGAAEGWAKDQSIFRVDGFEGGHASLSKQLQDGNFTPRGQHSWSWLKIATKWELISVPDPDVIPTLSLITKQGVYYEEQMRKLEKNNEFQRAKDYAKEAALHQKKDLAILTEEKAVAEKRVIREDRLKKLDTGDRRLLEAKGLKPFVHYKDQMSGWLWYE